MTGYFKIPIISSHSARPLKEVPQFKKTEIQQKKTVELAKLLKEKASVEQSLEKYQTRIDKLTKRKNAFTREKAKREFKSLKRKKMGLNALKSTLFVLSILGIAISITSLCFYCIGFVVSGGTTFGSAAIVAGIAQAAVSPVSFSLIFLVDTIGFIPPLITGLRYMGVGVGVLARRKISKARNSKQLYLRTQKSYQDRIDKIEDIILSKNLRKRNKLLEQRITTLQTA